DLAKSQELTDTLNALLLRIDFRPHALALIVAAEKGDWVGAVEQIANNPANPEKLRDDAVLALGALPTVDAVSDLRDVYLKTRPAVAIQALGQHARRRPSSPEAAAALKALQALVVDAQQKLEWSAAAVEALAGTRAGAEWLLKLHADK